MTDLGLRVQDDGGLKPKQKQLQPIVIVAAFA